MPNMLRFLFFYAPRSLRLPELEQKISFLDRHQMISVTKTYCNIEEARHGKYRKYDEGKGFRSGR